MIGVWSDWGSPWVLGAGAVAVVNLGLKPGAGFLELGVR